MMIDAAAAAAAAADDDDNDVMTAEAIVTNHLASLTNVAQRLVTQHISSVKLWFQVQ